MKIPVINNAVNCPKLNAKQNSLPFEYCRRCRVGQNGRIKWGRSEYWDFKKKNLMVNCKYGRKNRPPPGGDPFYK